MSPEAVFARIDELKRDDVRWRDGRAFTLAYYAGDDVLAVAEEAYRRFATENALNTDAFPSLRTHPEPTSSPSSATGCRRARGRRLHDHAAAPRAS